MNQITNDKVVTVTYRVEDEMGEVIERIDLPVNYLHGRDSGLVAKVEQALEGKTVGDEVVVQLTPAEGFGEWNPEMTFSDAIENAYDGIVLTDLQGNLTYANVSALVICGYTLDELTKLNVAQWVPDPQISREIIEEEIKTGTWKGAFTGM